MGLFLRLLFFLLVLPSASFATKYSCDNIILQAEVLRTENQMQSNEGFIRSRSLRGPGDTYEAMLMNDFIFDVTSLTSDQHVIDIGTGDGRAIFKLIEDFARRGLKPPATTAITITPTDTYYNDLEKFMKDGLPLEQHQLISGTPIEAMDISQIPKADIITDVFGAISYTADFSLVLEKILNLLKIGGRFYFFVALKRVTIIDENNSYVTLADYLSRIQGIRILRDSINSILIEKTSDDIVVPKLKLNRFKSDTPPWRIFKIEKSKVRPIDFVYGLFNHNSKLPAPE